LEFDGNAEGLGPDTLAARFSRTDFVAFLRSRGIFGLPVLGSCIACASGSDPAQFSPLDGGPSLTLAGPGGTRQLMRRPDGSYAASQSNGYPRLFLHGFSQQLPVARPLIEHIQPRY
jgi:hypothetical protein